MQINPGIVAYFAPGGGLGHLNRALAVCLRLRDAGVDGRIITNSPFAEGLALLARCPIVRLQTNRWAESARAFVQEMRLRAVVTDTFPYGLRDEWRGAPPDVPLIHVARRLLTPFRIEPKKFSLILQAEPLAEEHRTALGLSVALPGPILLPPGRIATPIPPPLDRDGLTFVVHSGPEEEVATLTALAQPPFVVVSPGSELEYYPATNLYCRARRIITGAGYNSMADLLAQRARHTSVAFPRRYDDQHARVQYFFREPADGTPQAVAAILSLL
ncbi:MAG: hypothetical protein ACKV2U_31410 [Bryobacteraceae bacterium]